MISNLRLREALNRMTSPGRRVASTGAKSQHASTWPTCGAWPVFRRLFPASSHHQDHRRHPRTPRRWRPTAGRPPRAVAPPPAQRTPRPLGDSRGAFRARVQACRRGWRPGAFPRPQADPHQLVEGRPNSGRAGVIGVVDDQPIADALEIPARGRESGFLEPTKTLVHGQTGRETGGRGSDGIFDLRPRIRKESPPEPRRRANGR